MKKRFLALMLLLCLLAMGARGEEGGPLLTPDDLAAIAPTYEAFLGEFADLLIARGLLETDQREEWLLYQMGDFMQNGGYGTIAVLYTPGVLENADEGVALRRLTKPMEDQTLHVETLQAYHLAASTLPGLPVEVSLTDETGRLVNCKFRLTASSGFFYSWDGVRGALVEMGYSVIADGRPIYWVDDPAGAVQETIQIEVLDINAETLLVGRALLKLDAGERCWRLAETPLE